MLYAKRLRAGQIDLIRTNRGKDVQLLPGAGYRYVQPLLPTIAIESTKCHRKLTSLIRTEGDREQHDVAFVPLDVFQVFNDDGFFAFVFKEPFQFGVFAALLIQQVEDQPLLFTVESDDTEREALFFRQYEPFCQPSHNHTCYGSGLVLVSASHAAGISAIYLVQLYRLGFRGW